MTDREVALEALSALCNSSVISFIPGLARNSVSGSPLGITGFMSALMGSIPRSGRALIINEDEFFDPKYDYDFTDMEDTETYYRGGEVYERPCGWKRYALKVLDKYPDGNAWLGDRGYCTTTSSVAGEWPVSYHGTSKKGAQGIIIEQFQPGPGKKYGRGVYSTPYMSEAVPYTKTFVSALTSKTYQVVLQNRVNPEHRQKYNSGKYWLVPIPEGLSKAEEQEIVEKAIRPYALLMKLCD